MGDIVNPKVGVIAWVGILSSLICLYFEKDSMWQSAGNGLDQSPPLFERLGRVDARPIKSAGYTGDFFDPRQQVFNKQRSRGAMLDPAAQAPDPVAQAPDMPPAPAPSFRIISEAAAARLSCAPGGDKDASCNAAGLRTSGSGTGRAPVRGDRGCLVRDKHRAVAAGCPTRAGY